MKAYSNCWPGLTETYGATAQGVWGVSLLTWSLVAARRPAGPGGSDRNPYPYTAAHGRPRRPAGEGVWGLSLPRADTPRARARPRPPDLSDHFRKGLPVGLVLEGVGTMPVCLVGKALSPPVPMVHTG